MSAALDAFAPGSGAGYRRFMEHAARLHRVSDRFFFWRPVGGLRDMINLKTTFEPSLLRDLLALHPGRSVAATVRSHVPDARVAQMLDHFTQYVGSAPDASPAVLCGIAHMQTGEGVWYPRGGTGAVPRALARLATELGCRDPARNGIAAHPARWRRWRSGSRDGVGREHSARCGRLQRRCRADPPRVARRARRPRASSAAALTNRPVPASSSTLGWTGATTICCTTTSSSPIDPEEEFEAIYQRGEPAPDPTCYVCAPARTEPDVAPQGAKPCMFSFTRPYLRPHHDWDRLFPTYRKTILEKLSRTAGLTDIEQHIRFERRLTPADIHERYGVLNGAIYGIASHGRWLGAFKPSNRSPDVKGLYLAGGAAHPGPGMPMVLMSGWIAADALDRDGVAGRTVRGKRLRGARWTSSGKRGKRQSTLRSPGTACRLISCRP